MGLRRGKVRVGHFVVAVLFAAMLWVPFYNRLEPRIAGIPFFYWYQLAFIPAGALLLLAAYLVENRAKRDGE